MKYVNKQRPNKVYYIHTNAHGVMQVKEHRNGCFATSLTLDGLAAAKFIKTLEDHGWEHTDAD